jgi:lon-related putative ATP-dependent protease
MSHMEPLRSEQLFRHCDPNQFDFESTAEISDPVDVIGQKRALEAIQFGMGIVREGYNLFALGPSGTGKRSLIRGFFERRAAQEPVPSDWCYVHNFEQTYQPNALRLPPGRGMELCCDMEELVEELRTTIQAVFESDEYQARRNVLQEELQERQQEALEELQERAREQDFALLRTPVGFVFAPTRDGQVIAPEELQELPQDAQKDMQVVAESLQEELQKILQQAPRWQRELRRQIRELDREVTNLAVTDLIAEIRQKYSDLPEVVAYLDAVHGDIVENVGDFLPNEDVQQVDQQLAGARGAPARPEGEAPGLRRYQVNVLVDHSESTGAPVVYEDNPSYQNLVGRVEHRAQMGMLLTDFNLIKPGALQRANGGYLILDARKLLLQPYAWEGLKRALRSNQVRIESVGQMLSVISTVSVEPEAIPLDIKVALVGDRELYYMLYYMDPDFGELFKVAADFDEDMDRNADTERQYAHLLASFAREEKLRPLDRSAVARVIEHASRMVSDTDKLLTHRQSICDVMREADYWAGESGNGTIAAADVQQAIDAQIYRSDRARERTQEIMQRGTVLIDTDGTQVGQINGLSVLQLGGFAFGRPSRITARVRLGRGEVIDIEREVELGGPLHSKGVLILSGFLRSRYVVDRPLSISASLVFEQSYGGIDGDSASSAELYALLSAISEVPIKQSFAVTGSVNQIGQVQAIGGVNQKIEGFFDLCKARGLTGEQGVLVPTSNVKNLMLRHDIVHAVREGLFNVYPVETIDQGIELLTGVPAGDRGVDGAYPEGTINHMVETRLSEMTDKLAAFRASGERLLDEEEKA